MTDADAGPAPVARPACPECVELSRRGLLRGAAVGGLTSLVPGGSSDVRVAAAVGKAASTDTLVLLSLRGGFDGLSAVVPAADPDYRGKRATIGVPASQLLPLDAAFGLHPAMAPLLPLWRDGQLAVVQDVGQAAPTRSHFEAMRELEKAAPGSGIRTGWLDRMLGALAKGTIFKGAQVGTSKPTDAFKGPAPELAVRRIDNFTLSGTDAKSLPKLTGLYRSLYSRAPEVIRTPALVAMDAVATTSRLKAAGYTPSHGVTYPSTEVGKALQDVARLIRAGVGLKVACVDVGAWDLHAGMGRVDGGQMRDRLKDLADAVAAFTADLADRMGSLTLVTLSEFGRRVAENGSGGTDHGHGNCVFVIGGGVAGGRMYGTWPGLSSSALVQGDLPGTTDYRQILAEIAVKRMGIRRVSDVFPGLKAAPLGILRARA
ncbi:MAG TPA: DUF1501 domain-containing protein [Kineosporiaceae bacterium]